MCIQTELLLLKKKKNMEDSIKYIIDHLTEYQYKFYFSAIYNFRTNFAPPITLYPVCSIR